MARKIITEEIKKNILQEYSNGISFDEIKCKFNICFATIDNIVNASGIPRNRRQARKKYDYEKICKLYSEGQTAREIAIELGGNYRRISEIVTKSGISRERRPRNHILASKTNSCPVFDSDFISYLDGLIISDGSLKKPNPYAAGTSYTQTCINREWLEEIQKTFFSKKIESVIFDDKRKGRRPSFVLRTKGYDQLFNQYHRWYKEGEKIVPKDIRLTVPFLKNWIYGDGTRVGTCLRLCCDSFSFEDVDFLLTELAKLSYNFKRLDMGLSKFGKPKWRIALGKRDKLYEFLNHVGEPIDCFKYKWRIV